MANVLGEGEVITRTVEDRVWALATKLRDSGTVDLTGVRSTYGNLLHELEKQQTFIEADNFANPDRAALQDTMTAEERETLARLRSSFPSDEDREWQRSMSRS